MIFQAVVHVHLLEALAVGALHELLEARARKEM